ncbi:ankyrin [Xylariomycetidae sp. FL2044]|nr:ankyrin [Xylariomycetidae sp. FL2044]
MGTPINLSEEEVDDLVYLARAGEEADLTEMLREVSGREGATPAQVLEAARDDGKNSCLHMAAANGHAKTVTLILSYFPPRSSTDRAGTAEPASGSASGSAATSEAGAETSAAEPPYINAQNTFGNSALHWACLGGHLDVVKLLLSRGASPAIANDKDQIPLDMAAFNHHMQIVDYFLSQSKDIEGDNAKQGGLENAAQDVDMEDTRAKGGEGVQNTDDTS